MLDNAVDKDIQSTLSPLNLMQNVIHCSKYRLRDNFITEHTTCYKLVATCASLVYFAAYINRAYSLHFDKPVRLYFNFLYILSFTDIFFYGIGIAMNFIISVVKTQENIRFVLTYQEVHRILKYGSENNPKQFVIWHWMSLLMIFSFYLFFVILSNLFFSTELTALTHLVLICFDANNIYSISLLRMLVDKLVLLDEKIQNLKSHRLDDAHCYKIFQAYVHILDCYHSYITSFQKTVSFYTI